ncbi:MAG: dynamin family protein, partial [Nitrosospira sp.]
MGRFKVGKSAFVNELLAQRLAGEDTNPETAAVTTFNHGAPVKATVRFVSKANWDDLKKLYKSNSADPDAQRVKTWFGLERKDSKTTPADEQQRFDLKELEQQFVREGGYAIDIVLDAALGKKGEADFRRKVKEFTTGTKPHHCLVETIEVIAPSAILNEGVVIIDTPGVDDIQRFRVALTEKAVENVDAILFLTKSGASYSQSEKNFLLSLLRKSTVKQLIFVITQVDQTYDQHVRQSRDQDEHSESIAKRIDREKTRILAEIDASLNDLSKDADDASMIRYREQFANALIEFTSAANHRDAQQGETVKYPLLDGDPGGIKRVQRTLFETLSTESRLAATARSIETGARTILEAQLRLLESRRGAIKRLKNREVAEKGLATFRDQFGKAGEEFSKAVAADITFLTAAFTQRDKLAAMAIENISLNAEIVLAEYETNDAGRHWRSRRSGYWGYMRDLQSRVANKIFPAVATMLGGYTDELNGYVVKFKVHLGALSSASTRIADDLDLEA